MSNGETRVRRPKDKEQFIQTLCDEGGFITYRDVLLYAAAVGFAHNQRIPFSNAGEPIRYNVMVGLSWSAQFIDMLGIHGFDGDSDIMRDDRLGERITVFEEYANGGLTYLEDRIAQGQLPIDEVCTELVIDAFIDSPSTDDLPSAEELAKELDF